MKEILLFFIGAMSGSGLSIILFALLSMSKRCEQNETKAEIFKEGYQKGYDDGYELRQSHLK